MHTGRRWVDRRINILNQAGEQIPVSISTSILRDQDGRQVGGVESFRDLSALECLRREIEGKYTFQDIVSKNNRMRGILEILPDIAASESTVLIQGATGTGKELVARAIHNLSPRKRHKFIAINCGALPDTLLESELFGYRKGAFTGADRDKPGRFALAEKGTVFLDEIGDISTALQIRLLRVLQEREYEPLGATTTVHTNVRIIAATNRVLVERVARGHFREDLFYRLNVVKIDLPPLAERREDIPLLVEHFLRQLNAQRDKQIRGISEEALKRLMQHGYPGNVRELQNILEYALVVCRGDVIELDCLPADILGTRDGTGSTQPPVSAEDPLMAAEAEAIRRTLLQHGGHRARTAAALGIDKSTLWRKMKKYSIRYP
jgi:transcriptional regulator with PAS, ATPase and Fis domain